MENEGTAAIRAARGYLKWLKREGMLLQRPDRPEAAPFAAPAAPRPASTVHAESVREPEPSRPYGPASQHEPAIRSAAAARPAQSAGSQGPSRPAQGAPPPASAPPSRPDDPPEIAALRAEVNDCRKCVLGSSRKNAVFGDGNLDADLVFIGEAPGATEDEKGLPFVGASGNLLTRELEKNGIKRAEVFICNVLKCRPPDNRDPLPEEIAACEPHLLRQLELIRPKMLCALGRFALGTLLKRPVGIMKMRGDVGVVQRPAAVRLPASLGHPPFAQQPGVLRERYSHAGRSLSRGARGPCRIGRPVTPNLVWGASFVGWGQ